MNGTPSCAFGTVIPWKWRTVGWSSWFSHHDPDVVAVRDVDLRARDLAVERHRIHELSLRDLPLHAGRGEREDLRGAVHRGCQELVPLGRRLVAREECVDTRLVHRRHHLRAHTGSLARGSLAGGARPGGSCAWIARSRRDRGQHAEVLVPGHRAVRRIRSGVEGGNLQDDGRTWVDELGLVRGAGDVHGERMWCLAHVHHGELDGLAHRDRDGRGVDRELAEHDLNRRRAGRSLFRRSTASGAPGARRAHQRDGTCDAQRPPSPDRSHHRALLVCVGIGHVASSIRSSASPSIGRGSRARRDQRHRRIVDPAGTLHACSRAISSSFRSSPWRSSAC